MLILQALRNIARNKKDSAVIILFIGIITFLFFIGNTVLWQQARGLRVTFAGNVTSDIVIEKKALVTMSLFGANAPVIEDFFTLEPLPAYDEVKKAALAMGEVEALTSQVSCAAVMDVNDKRRGVYLCGIESETYFSLFPGITLLEGAFITAGSSGAMITEARREKIEKESGKPLKSGDKIIFTSAGEAGFKIREVPLKGIYSYTNSNEILDEIVLTDCDTARVLSAIQVASSDVKVDKSALSLLENGNLEDIDLMFDESYTGGAAPEIEEAEADFPADILPEAYRTAPDSGGEWNFILIKLKEGADAGAVIKKLNNEIEPLGALAVNWRVAAGISAILLLLLQFLYNAGILIVSFAGVIALINILLIAVFRRTKELGTLRAIGAGDFYIRSLLISENCFLALSGAFAGLIASFVLILCVNAAGIKIGNSLLATLLGGGVLRIVFSPVIALFSVVFAVVIVLLSTAIPVETAVRIKPVAALREA